MPKITDERREARREQVLEAARACLEEHGLEAVSMEMIIARSGLSTGAVYGYFKGKDQIINAVGTRATSTDCWSHFTAGATPRVILSSRRPPGRRTQVSASYSPTW